ncbi:TPA: AAA family ATPase [Vibrio parahaemolyticus]|nr:AAA family ATPase [Vibrio parahaemolyticus]HCH1612084.1 AAA family ATPase [Vibrio parahaemolyticus]
MNKFFTENKIESYKKIDLHGLNNESNKILNFCKLVWSDNWIDKKKIYRFNPTIMLYGSPGTGKTTLLKNIAHDLNDNDFKYFSLSLELLLDKDLGMSSKYLKEFFNQIENWASMEHKVFIHFDDVDSVLCSRYTSNESSGVKRLVNTFIKEIDKIQSTEHTYSPIISTTTNMYSLIDTAVKRRFSLKFSIENRISNIEFESWLKPILLDLDIIEEVDYSFLYRIMEQRELTIYDIYLIMQDLLLDKLSGTKISYEIIVASFNESHSSKVDFEKHRKSLSSL